MSTYYSPFPVNALPESLANYAKAVAESVQCPPDFPAAMALAVMSSAVGMARVVRIKPDWSEPPLLYLGIVAPPSSKKSPALAKVLQPVNRKQIQFYDTFQASHADWEEDLQAWEAVDKKNRGPKPEKPTFQRTFVTDATMEALARVLAENPNGLLLSQDELAAWVKGMDQYRSKGTDLERWLSIWTCSPIIIDRVGRDEPLFLTHPFVSVVGGIQPDRLKLLSGNEHDGFIDRILFCFPDEKRGHFSDYSIPTEIEAAYCECYDQLFKLAPHVNEKGEVKPIPLHFTPDARTKMIHWINYNAEEIYNEGSPRLKSAFGKLESYALRLSLILQLCKNPSSIQIQVTAVEQARTLTEYFKQQARKVQNHVSDKKISSRFQKAVSAIKAKGGKVTAHEAYTAKICGISKATPMKKLFDELQTEGYGQVYTDQPSSGGRPTVSFHLRSCDCPRCNQQSVFS